MVSIGPVFFGENLKWVPKNEDVHIVGSDTRTRDGSIVSIRSASGNSYDEFRTYRFGKITFVDWQKLQRMIRVGVAYDFKPESGGRTYRVHFAHKNPLTIDYIDPDTETISGGEIRLIFPSGSIRE